MNMHEFYPVSQRLLASVQAVCPGAELVIRDLDDKATWRLRYGDGAGAQQRAAAQAALDAFEPSVPAPEDYQNAIQAHVNATAQQRQYDSGTSMASYVTDPNPTWAAEAQTFVAWRSAVWAYAYGELAKVQGGQRAQPSVETLAAGLPEIVWP